MPHRFPILERIAFALFLFSAVADATFIGYQKSPDFRDNLQEIARLSAQAWTDYPALSGDPWMPLGLS
jgi:hypothetical protein